LRNEKSVAKKRRRDRAKEHTSAEFVRHRVHSKRLFAATTLQPAFSFFSLHRSQPESSASGSRGRREMIGLMVLSREDDCADSATFCVLLAGSILAYIVHDHDVTYTHRADL